MTFLSLLAALVLEQAWPLREGNRARRWFGRYALLLQGQFDGGERRHGVIAWMLAVLPLVAVTVAVHQALHAASPLAGGLWSVAVLYFTMGFRQFSHYFADIQQALRAGDLAPARDRLGRWRGESAQEFNAGEIARVAVEQGLLASHRHVFGTLFWFVALGPGGAVLHRASVVIAGLWTARADPESGVFGRFARRACYWLEWVPAWPTAVSFAVVGDFEDAIYCWRTQAAAWAAQPEGIVLATGGGALGVRLGGTLHQHGSLTFRPELGVGEEADADGMQSAAGLVWRALVLWMFLILVISFAHALG
ncbi:MAG: CobD/CbiB family protein [Betaproteobacteria bacterium]|nr:CobD/CbiB family protein [Betaproteobacteria bacterium]